jgi:hypothetical protein
MELKVTIQYGGTEREIDLTNLDRYGKYHVDHESGLIIDAPVYSQGTPNSRFVRGDVVYGTDYEFEPIEVDSEAFREQVQEELRLELTNSEVEQFVKEYGRAGTEIVGHFSEQLDRYQILERAREGIVSTDVEEPLVGWEHTFGGAVERALKQTNLESRREVTYIMFKALQQSSPGSCEYNARIKLTD